MANEGSTKPTYSELERLACRVIHVDYAKGTSCIDKRSEAIDHPERYAADFRVELVAKKHYCNDCYATDKILELESELARVRGLLQRLEWDGDGYCPFCHANMHAKAHKADCQMAAALNGTPANQAMPSERQWISVEDRLPEEKGWYLIYGEKTDRYDIGLLLHKKTFMGHALQFSDVTHWMPIPNFQHSSDLVPSGAESAHSGKLDTADKSGPELLPTQLPKEK